MKFYLLNDNNGLANWGRDAIRHLRESKHWVDAIIHPPKFIHERFFLDGKLTRTTYKGVMWSSWWAIVSHCGICLFLGVPMRLLGFYPKD